MKEMEPLDKWSETVGNAKADPLEAVRGINLQSKFIAAIDLLESKNPDDVHIILEQILVDPNPRFQMMMAPFLVWGNHRSTFETLMNHKGTHEYVLFALVMTMKFQKKPIPLPILAKTFDNPSPFVRLGTLDYCSKMSAHHPRILSTLVQLRKEAPSICYDESDKAPSPVFGKPKAFHQTLRTIRTRLVKAGVIQKWERLNSTS